MLFGCKDNNFLLEFRGLDGFHSVVWTVFVPWFGRILFGGLDGLFFEEVGAESSGAFEGLLVAPGVDFGLVS